MPDEVDLTLSSEQDGTVSNVDFQAWLAAIERSGPSASAVALSIARCPEVDAARGQASHPCRPLVSLQPSSPSTFQVPEGWAGNIRSGRVLFLSSNPSISEAGDAQSGSVAELYPTADWDDENLTDFILHRFDSRHGWATPAGHFLRKDGTYLPKPVAFWNNVPRRAGELLDGDANPAQDYAMTEVVHCESKGDAGVASAARTCADRHLDAVLTLSPAPLVVVLGSRARNVLGDLWPLNPEFGRQKGPDWRERDNLALLRLGGRDRVIAYLWHPTGTTAPKTFAGAYPAHLDALRALVQHILGPTDVIET